MPCIACIGPFVYGWACVGENVSGEKVEEEEEEGGGEGEGEGYKMAMDDTVRFGGYTNSTESPRHVERTLLLYHSFQKVVYGLEFNERRNVKPAIVRLARVDFTDAWGGSAFKRALNEVVFPMGG